MEIFAIGLAIGLSIAFMIKIQSWCNFRRLQKENTSLKEHLHTQMTINAAGYQETYRLLNEYKKRCDNLQHTVFALKTKTSKHELETLYIYDKAIHLMYRQVPGFASAWETVVADAMAELKKTDTGVTAWVRRHITLIAESPKSYIVNGSTHSLLGKEYQAANDILSKRVS